MSTKIQTWTDPFGVIEGRRLTIEVLSSTNEEYEAFMASAESSGEKLLDAIENDILSFWKNEGLPTEISAYCVYPAVFGKIIRFHLKNMSLGLKYVVTRLSWPRMAAGSECHGGLGNTWSPPERRSPQAMSIRRWCSDTRSAGKWLKRRSPGGMGMMRGMGAAARPLVVRVEEPENWTRISGSRSSKQMRRCALRTAP